MFRLKQTELLAEEVSNEHEQGADGDVEECEYSRCRDRLLASLEALLLLRLWHYSLRSKRRHRGRDGREFGRDRSSVACCRSMRGDWPGGHVCYNRRCGGLHCGFALRRRRGRRLLVRRCGRIGQEFEVRVFTMRAGPVA